MGADAVEQLAAVFCKCSDATAVPFVRFSFVEISKIAQVDKDSVIGTDRGRMPAGAMQPNTICRRCHRGGQGVPRAVADHLKDNAEAGACVLFLQLASAAGCIAVADV